jgi:processed acidic surface protein
MKRMGVLLLICSILVSLLPYRAYAAENVTTDLDLTAYLQEISASRGFEVSRDDIEYALYMNYKTLGEFKTVDELKAFLGEVILADNSNLANIYSKYNLEFSSLSEVLKENGEELRDYIFISDLDKALDYYIVTKEVDFESKLDAYLAEVSKERGFTITREAINTILEEYAYDIDDFETVDELSDFLGDVIKADFSNLDYFEDNFKLNKEALFQLLEDNGININDLIYMDQIEEVVWDFAGDNEPDIDLTEFMSLLNQVGITEVEIDNLQNHLIANDEFFSSDETLAVMEDITSRLEASAENIYENIMKDEDYKPSDEEISEIASLFEELLSALKLKASYSLIKDGVETKYTLEQLMKIETIEYSDFKIELYNDQSVLLLDAVITEEFIKSNLGDVIDEVDDLTETVVKDHVLPTVKGGKLPKTASNHIPMTLLGIAMTIGGALVYRKVKANKSENPGE